MSAKFIIGIDLGGTNLKAGLLGKGYDIKRKITLKSKKFTKKEELIAAIISCVEFLIKDKNLNKRQILGIGVGVPGPTDYREGVVHFLPNIPGWREVKLKNILEKKLKIPVFIDNDAKLMAMAEYEFGNARVFENVLCLTLGTGVGGGLIIGRSLYRGRDNAAGEIGHLPINEKGPRCNCGGIACLEAYIGNAKIIKNARKSFKRGISLEELSVLALKGNKAACKVWFQAARHLGTALAGLVTVLNLDAIIIGGGVAAAGKILFDQVKNTIRRRSMSAQGKRVQIFKAKLGNDAGIIGAAKLVKDAMKLIFLGLFILTGPLYAQEIKAKTENAPGPANSIPLTINADNVEYGADTKNVTAAGNVEIFYKGAKLTCQKLTVNTETKEGLAEGGVRLESSQGIIEGESFHYNFQNKTGYLKDAIFRAAPYFGRARNLDKVSESELIAFNGYATTCSYDHPHYRIKSKRINIFPGNKIQTKSDEFLFGDIPVMSIPYFSQSFKDPLMHVQLSPGKRKDWGYYMLSQWRLNLAQNMNGQVYFDARTKWGLAEGFGTNYLTPYFGNGDFKFYYTHETPGDLPANTTSDQFQRYLVRWRHKWDIDKKTNFVSEYYQITDEKRKELGPNYNFLKDYFYREFEQDAQPLTYLQVHHAFDYSSLDLLVQQRTNSWYNPGYLEKSPEVKFSMPSYKIGDTPFYFDNNSTGGAYNLKNSSTTLNAASTPDTHVNRLDTVNKLSMPLKVAFIQLTPFTSSRQTFYSDGLNGDVSPRTIFSTGADMSTKFYRTFDVRNNFLGMDINGLRHIITPTVSYNYSHTPTVTAAELRQIDGVDVITTSSNTAALTLSNKLQTKRNGTSVDFVDFLVTNSYNYKPKDKTTVRGGFSDYIFKLIFLPYSWVRLDADATYTHSGSRDLPNFNTLSNINLDANFSLGKDRSLGFSQRYLRKGSNSMIYNFKWLLNTKWAFSFYDRFERGSDQTLEKGLVEEEYTIIRDLHCWDMSITYNRKSGQGASVFILFRLKAFPELNFNFNQSYHKPTTGAQ